MSRDYAVGSHVHVKEMTQILADRVTSMQSKSTSTAKLHFFLLTSMRLPHHDAEQAFHQEQSVKIYHYIQREYYIITE